MIKSWMVIGAVTFIVALGGSILRPADVRWFKRLRRPSWLTFEALIPLIWTVIFICGAWSADIVWERQPESPNPWFLMALYLLLEITILAYQPATLWTRNLRIGTIVGGAGFVLGLILTMLVLTVSGQAALLLVPYLLWSPIGTYTTWQMYRLNSGRRVEERTYTSSRR